MNVINKYFDNVYVITTSIETERQQYIMNYMKNHGIHYNLRTAIPSSFVQSYNTIDLWNAPCVTSAGNVSLCLTYLSIFSECLYKQKYKLLVLEDDVSFEPDYQTKFEAFMNSVGDEWDVLNLGYHPSKEDGFSWKYFKVNDIMSESEVSWTTHMVAFNNKDTLIDLKNKIIKDTPLPIDFVISYFTHICKCHSDPRTMRSYIPNDILCRQLSYRDSETKSEHKLFKSLIG